MSSISSINANTQAVIQANLRVLNKEVPSFHRFGIEEFHFIQCVDDEYNIITYFSWVLY